MASPGPVPRLAVSYTPSGEDLEEVRRRCRDALAIGGLEIFDHTCPLQKPRSRMTLLEL